MLLLTVVSLVWAFSFGLIKRLAGLDPTAIAAVRLAIASLVFLPVLRVRGISRIRVFQLGLVGAIQFGIMYLLYLRAFRYLQSYEIALFTVFTPLYLAFIDALWERRWKTDYIVAALLAVAAAGIVLWKRAFGGDVLAGFLLVQASNVCFALGQLAYRRIRPALDKAVTDMQVFALLTAGGFLATCIASLSTTDWSAFRPTSSQILVLVYLGAIASGVGFWLWNLGAVRVNAGTLAAFNNLKVPLGVACSLLVFDEHADVPRLIASLALLALAVWIAERKTANPA